MKLAPTVGIALVALSASCVKPAKIKPFGPDTSLRPTVEITAKSRVPLGLKITTTEESDVVAFLVQPGSPTVLLYPADSTGSAKLQPGVHDVATIYAAPVRVDSNGLLRRPQADTTANARGNGAGGGYNGRGGRGGYGPGGGGRGMAPGAFEIQAYVYVFASTQPLPFDSIEDKIVGVSIPIDESDAFKTVTMLLREAAKPENRWAAVAVPFHP